MFEADLNAHIQVFTAFFALGSVFASRSVLVASSLLTPFRARGRGNSAAANRGNSLGLYMGEHLRCGLGLGSRRIGNRYGQRRYLHHSLINSFGRNTLLFKLLHGRNEETVKHYMVNCILDKYEEMISRGYAAILEQ